MAESDWLTGEPLALDLINTRPRGPGGRSELLASPEQLARWLALQAERFEEGVLAAAPTGEDLRPVHEVRRHTEAVVRALLDSTAPPASALRGLNAAQRAAAPVRELGWDGTGFTATTRRPGPLGLRLAAQLADAAVELFTDPAIGRLKECEAEDCVMVFLPAHPRRRWCSPARCGNRTRVARYYRRHNSTDGTEDVTGSGRW